MTTTTPTSSAPPDIVQLGPIAWLHKNLFSSWSNSILTIVIVALLLNFLRGFVVWVTTTAQWEVIPLNLPRFMVGLYPANQYWRIWIAFGIITALAGLSWGVLARQTAKLFSLPVLIGIGASCVFMALVPVPPLYRLMLLAGVALVVAGAWVGRQAGRKLPALGRWVSLAWFVSFFVVLWLIGGGLFLRNVSSNDWGGLMLTLIAAIVSIVLCFPAGVVLALGRQSSLPVVRWFSVLYIELIRGIPLIAILFMGQVMLPLFLSPGARVDRILRAIVGLTLFSAAYLAENVRGGLQAIPRGQTEAANALGLNTPLTVGLVVLPQALKISIPAIVGQFISLFQDTTLLAVVGLVELLGISRSILANPQFLGRYAEVYLFIGIIYWVFCYTMSIASRRLERQLNAGQR
ncbi:amino acid ABC transporter permease [Oculatella sp. LEGE 06141]|uniref:amino acid ABC transporter permease n=1 Tax=Oculatella sp. LEGE 06141 TaxID=1828648 RepID=UPI00187EAB86|nr:amino acid ABC transporter permease [Oculatella sp. LEGE 06141]MBE9178307.1 amino acid ABC transporter permease [Oculatella sp. LEGE 06141]